MFRRSFVRVLLAFPFVTWGGSKALEANEPPSVQELTERAEANRSEWHRKMYPITAQVIDREGRCVQIVHLRKMN